MYNINRLQHCVLKLGNHNCDDSFRLASQFLNHFQIHFTTYKTHLPSFAMGILHDESVSLTNIPLLNVGNKNLYRPRRFLQSNLFGIDISTSRLWYAMLMTKHGDYHLSLGIVNKLLSSISPFALYYSGLSICHVSGDTKERYIDMFISNDADVTKRAREAWMFDFRVMPLHMDMVPIAIHVELVHSDDDYGLCLSTFVCAYYLMFLNYCGLRQYDNRDRALRQLIDVVNNPEQRGHHEHNSYNIAGHCLLSIEEPEQALYMFIRSYMFTLPHQPFHHYNSAKYYLQCLSH